MGELTLYFDRCFGKRFPDLVERMKPPFVVQSHFKLKFKDEMSDDDWLSKVGQKGWTVISHDAKFHMESPALKAITQFNIGCFYLWGAQLPVWNKVALLTHAFPKMHAILKSQKTPFIYQINHQGRPFVVRHWDGRKEPQRHLRASKQAELMGKA